MNVLKTQLRLGTGQIITTTITRFASGDVVMVDEEYIGKFYCDGYADIPKWDENLVLVSFETFKRIIAGLYMFNSKVKTPRSRRFMKRARAFADRYLLAGSKGRPEAQLPLTEFWLETKFKWNYPPRPNLPVWKEF